MGRKNRRRRGGGSDGGSEEPGNDLSPEQRKRLAELDEAIAKFESQKRWSDMIRSVSEKVEVVSSSAEKIALLHQAGTLYLEKSRNQTEAIKCFERIIELDASHGDAIEKLKDLYQKRSRWADLIALLRKEAESMQGEAQVERMVEIAELATQHVRKPDVCIELWESVLASAPHHAPALKNLADLYERARQWEPLAKVLEERADASLDLTEQQPLLQKLGVIFADKLGDDEGAIRVFRKLLDLDPNDRRAQEQLKRRYVALGKWDELEQFYARHEKWDELIRVLERQAEGQETSPDDKMMLLFRAARLWVEKLNRPDRAARVYEKILAGDPENLEAAEALTPIYEAGRDPRKLIQVCEARLKHARDAATQAMLIRKIAHVYEDRMRIPETAFEKYLEAFAIDPTNHEVREDAERIAEALDGWERLISGYQAAIEGETDPAMTVRIRNHYGDALGKLDRVEDAIEQYRIAYDNEPDNAHAIQALGELYFKTERFRELLDIYERRLELEQNREIRLDIAYRQAALWEEALQDQEHAIECYERIIDEYGVNEVDAGRALDRLYEATGRYNDLVALYERRIEAGPESNEELAALKFRLARTLDTHLRDRAQAVELYGEVLGVLPEHDGARDTLEEMLGDDEHAARAAALLETVYTAPGREDDLIRVLRVLQRFAEGPEEQVHFATRIGDVYLERLSDFDAGFAAYAEAFRVMPSHTTVLGTLEDIAERQDKFQELVALISDAAAEVSDLSLCRGLWIKAAETYHERLNNTEGAVSAYRKVLEDNDEDIEVLSALELLYRREERWRDVVGVLRGRVDAATEPEQRIKVLSEMAAIELELLEEPREAISLYTEILDNDPTHQEALLAHYRLYEAQGMWSEFTENIERRVELEEDEDQKVSLMLRLAQVQTENLASEEAAIGIYRDILAEREAEPNAMGALEQLLQSSAHQQSVAEILEPIYERGGDAEKLLGIYEIQAEHALTPEEKLALYQRIAETRENTLNDLDGAFQAYARAFAQDIHSDELRSQLERLGSAVGDQAGIAKVYELQAEQSGDVESAVELHQRAAQVYENNVGDRESAIREYRQVLELDPQNEAAINRLEALYQESESYEKLADVYAAKARVVSDLEEQQSYLFKAAAVYEDLLDQPEQAAAIYTEIRELDPGDLQAVERLIALQRKLGNWEALIKAYEAKAEASTDPELECEVYSEMAAILEQELQDPERAIVANRRVLDIRPDDREALARLDRQLEAQGQWQELLDIVERQLDLAEGGEERIALRFKKAELWRKHLQDNDRAVDNYRDILRDVNGHVPSLEALEQMLAAGQEPLGAARVLSEVYRDQAESAKLAAVFEAELGYMEDSFAQSERLHQLGELYEVQLGDSERAFATYARALRNDAQDEAAISGLERLGAQSGDWHNVASVFDEIVEQADAETQAELVHLIEKSAQAHELHLQDTQGAIERYQRLVAVDDLHAGALQALDRLYEASEQWPELAQVLTQEIEVAATPDDVLALQYRAGKLCQNYLGQEQQAIGFYREIVSAAPEHEGAAQALEELFTQSSHTHEIAEVLEPLYRMREDWASLLRIQEQQASELGSGQERRALLQRMVEIAEDKCGDVDRAFHWMQSAVLEEPGDEFALNEVERLGRLTGDWSGLATTLVDGIEKAGRPEERVGIAHRLARVYEEEFAAVDQAEETYRYILGTDAKDEVALRNLDRIYSNNGAHHALSQVLRTRLECASSLDQRTQLGHRLGEVLHRDLGHSDEAIPVFMQVLEQDDPTHQPTIHALQDIYARQGQWQPLFNIFEKELNAVSGDAQQSDVYARMARLCSEHLQDHDRSVELWKRVLDLRGEDREALNALGNLYNQQQNWRDLVEVLDREAEVCESDEARAQIYADLARIWQEKLNRARNAIENWERVVDIDPSRMDALLAIAEIHRGTAQWGDFADTLHRVVSMGAGTLENETLVEAYTQMGYACHTQLGQTPEAIDAYEKALEVDPFYLSALDALEAIHRADSQWEDAIGVMERRVPALESARDKVSQLLSITKVWQEELEEPTRAVSAFVRVLELQPLHLYALRELERIHRDAGSFEELADVYVRWAEAEHDSAERVVALRKLAEVYEHELDDMDQAYQALQIAWSEDYEDKDTLAELERVTAYQNKWNDLLATANELLQAAEEPETKIAICLHCAKWYGQDLNYPEYAIPYYEQIRSLDPTNAQAWWQLGDLYEATQQWDNLAQVLGRLVEMSDDEQVRANTFVRMGGLADDRFGMRQDAENYYRQALDLVPQHLGALEALEKLYQEEGRSNKLLAILEKKAEVADDNEAVVSARLQVAEAYEQRLDDPEAAIRSYEQALELQPGQIKALRGLERLYALAERWNDLAEVLNQELEVVETESERIDLLMRLGRMHEEHFRNPEKAAELMEQVVEIDPLYENALEGLGRIYFQLQRWEELEQSLERHISVTPERENKIALLERLGSVQQDELKQPDRAIDSYLNILELEEHHIVALRSLYKLYAESEDHARALDIMESLCQLAEDPEEQVRLQFEMGEILDQKLGDRSGAVERYQTAVDLDPTYLPALDAVYTIHADAGDWRAATSALEQALSHDDKPRSKAKRLVQLAQISGQHLDEGERAQELYKEALESDPDNVEAALPVAEAYLAQRQHAEALPLLQLLVSGVSKGEPEERKRLALMLGECALHSEDADEAVRAFTQVQELAPGDLESARGLANAHFLAQNWDEALKQYQMLLVQHRDDLAHDEVTEIYYRLGAIKRETGEPIKARNMFDKALEEDPHYRPALDDLIAIYETEKDWQQVIHYKRQLLDVLEEDAERRDALEAIGDLWLDELGNSERAALAYSEATDVDPKAHVVLHKLLKAQQLANQWADAVDTIDRIATLEERAEAKSKYSHTIAVILRDKLEDKEGACERFNESLDHDPTNLKAFEAINKLLNEDVKGLERAYRKMLHRVVGKGQPDFEYELWHNLGLIYRDRQKNFEAAAESFKMAATVKPEVVNEHQILAELYTALPEHTVDAIAEHQWLLRDNPNRLESYRALYKLYFDLREHDKAWCVAAALYHLKQADAEQEQYYRQYKKEAFTFDASAVISHELWSNAIMHPKHQRLLSKVLEAMSPAVYATKVASDRALKIKSLKPEDLEKSSRAFTKIYRSVIDVLNIPARPRLYLKADAVGGMTNLVGANPPAVMVGSTLLSGFRPAELMFVIGRHLAHYRPEFFTRTLVSSHTEFKTLLLGALRIVGVGAPNPEVDAVAKKLGSKFRQQADLDRLRTAVREFMGAGADADIKYWMQTVELSAMRAGFAMCNDLDVAARMIQALPADGSVDVPVKEKLMEVVLFSVSEEYFQIRQLLGITIQV